MKIPDFIPPRARM